MALDNMIKKMLAAAVVAVGVSGSGCAHKQGVVDTSAPTGGFGGTALYHRENGGGPVAGSDPQYERLQQLRAQQAGYAWTPSGSVPNEDRDANRAPAAHVRRYGAQN